jgi:poly(A) polymerase
MTEEFKKGITKLHSIILDSNLLPGADIVDKVIVGTAEWSELFAKHDFFHKYRYYLQVIASTGNADLQIKWWVGFSRIAVKKYETSTCCNHRSGTVESRLRQLVMKLEYVDSLTLAHPFVKGFDLVSHCISDDEVRAVAQGEVSEAVKRRKKEDIEGKDGASVVYSTTFYIGLAIEPKQRAYLMPSMEKAFNIPGSLAFH